MCVCVCMCVHGSIGGTPRMRNPMTTHAMDPHGAVVCAGFRVVHCPIPGPLCSANIVLATEASDNKGLPHTLEHLTFMVWRGTRCDGTCVRRRGKENNSSETPSLYDVARARTSTPIAPWTILPPCPCRMAPMRTLQTTTPPTRCPRQALTVGGHSVLQLVFFFSVTPHLSIFL